MDRNESERLQQEIKFWTNAISSHKKSSSRYKLAGNLEVPKAYTWNNTKTAKSSPIPQRQFNDGINKADKKHQSRYSTSNTSHSDVANPYKGVTKNTATTLPSTSKYKWKSVSSESSLHSGKASSYKFVSSKNTSPKTQKNVIESASLSNSRIPQLSPKPVFKKKPNLRSAMPQQTTQFTWSKTVKSSSPSSVSHFNQSATEQLQLLNSTVASISKKTITQPGHTNTRHRYRRLSSGSEKSGTKRLTARCVLMSNHILSKYKLKKTPSFTRRLSVNVSKNPYKVIKKRTLKTPNSEFHKRENTSSFSRPKTMRYARANVARHRHNRRFVYIAQENSHRKRNLFGGKRSFVTNNRFKLVQSRIQTRSYKSGNIVLRRKQLPANKRHSGSFPLKPLLRTPTTKQRMASHALHKSLATVRTKNRHKLQKVYCIFYNRFGKCNRGDKCKYTHDPDRVAICTQFLRGTCRGEACPFSHKASKHKMPVCNFFLRGKCSAKSCPYLHVFVGHDAPVCKNFATNGYCQEADNCKKLHIRACPEFYDVGTCSRGTACNLPHKRKTARKRKGPNQSVPSTSQSPTKPRASNQSSLKDEANFISLPQSSTCENNSLPTFSDDPVPKKMRIQPVLKMKQP